MKKKRRRRPNSGFLGVQDSRRPLFVVDLMGEGESSALPFTGLVGEREGESGSAEGIVLMPVEVLTFKVSDNSSAHFCRLQVLVPVANGS
ncbi:hypothetical protein EJ110_NYTH47731 [Nymphaea thermarum]|nr:hypothetical protein EJ110_NYTH47731 [Nymphaea thermarum]